jgi:hypothetical protein
LAAGARAAAAVAAEASVAAMGTKAFTKVAVVAVAVAASAAGEAVAAEAAAGEAEAADAEAADDAEVGGNWAVERTGLPFPAATSHSAQISLLAKSAFVKASCQTLAHPCAPTSRSTIAHAMRWSESAACHSDKLLSRK